MNKSIIWGKRTQKILIAFNVKENGKYYELLPKMYFECLEICVQKFYKFISI